MSYDYFQCRECRMASLERDQPAGNACQYCGSMNLDRYLSTHDTEAKARDWVRRQNASYNHPLQAILDQMQAAEAVLKKSYPAFVKGTLDTLFGPFLTMAELRDSVRAEQAAIAYAQQRLTTAQNALSDWLCGLPVDVACLRNSLARLSPEAVGASDAENGRT